MQTALTGWSFRGHIRLTFEERSEQEAGCTVISQCLWQNLRILLDSGYFWLLLHTQLRCTIIHFKMFHGEIDG